MQQRNILYYVLALVFAATAGIITGNLANSSPTATAPHRMVELAFYVILAPSLIYLAIDYLLARYYWFAALFAMLSIERIYLLTILLNNATGNTNQSAANGLVPVVLILSIILVRLVGGRIAYQIHLLLPSLRDRIPTT